MTILTEELLLDPSTASFEGRPKTDFKMIFVWKGERGGWAAFYGRNGECIYADPTLFWMEGMRLPRVLKLLRKRKLSAIVRDDI